MITLPLFIKVALLVAGCMVGGGVGAYFGREVRSLGAFLVLAVLFIFGTLGVMAAAHASTLVGILALAIWTFISGLVIGPAIQIYAAELGWETVSLAYLGTAGVMLICAMIGGISGVDFSGMGNVLVILLMGLIIFGIMGIFIRMSRTVNIVYSLIGMFIFAGYFIFDFFRLSKSENTWEAAINLSISIYLDFLNFFLKLLQFLAAVHDKH